MGDGSEIDSYKDYSPRGGNGLGGQGYLLVIDLIMDKGQNMKGNKLIKKLIE
jgi:hypothetical protein